MRKALGNRLHGRYQCCDTGRYLPSQAAVPFIVDDEVKFIINQYKIM